MRGQSNCSSVAGLPALWAKTLGHSAIKIAVLDGPIDHSHIAFKGANLQRVEPPGGSAAGGGVASQHGTHVASILFGQHDGPVIGVAPGCSGIIIPIFKMVREAGLLDTYFSLIIAYITITLPVTGS